MKAAMRYHPLRTLCGVEKLQRLPRPATLRRIGTAVRDHPVRTCCGVENVSRLPNPAALRRIKEAVRDRPLRTPCGVESATPATPYESYACVLCGAHVT
eukprot:7906598-Pyramimonas_sp.AAC.1